MCGTGIDFLDMRLIKDLPNIKNLTLCTGMGQITIKGVNMISQHTSTMGQNSMVVLMGSTKIYEFASSPIILVISTHGRDITISKPCLSVIETKRQFIQGTQNKNIEGLI